MSENFSPITSTFTPKWRGRVLPKGIDVSKLDALLLDGENIKPCWAEELRVFPDIYLSTWCHKHGVYQVPTWELIQWLKREIAGRSAIEICAGRSCLGQHLGIPMVDNYSHTWPEIAMVMAFTGQPPTLPPRQVHQMDANEAVARAKPQVVLGAWVSQKRYGDEDHANEYGPDEHAILDAGCTYIHVGNTLVHGTKRILLRDHRCLNFNWNRSRAMEQNQNRIWIWD